MPGSIPSKIRAVGTVEVSPGQSRRKGSGRTYGTAYSGVAMFQTLRARLPSVVPGQNPSHFHHILACSQTANITSPKQRRARFVDRPFYSTKSKAETNWEILKGFAKTALKPSCSASLKSSLSVYPVHRITRTSGSTLKSNFNASSPAKPLGIVASSKTAVKGLPSAFAFRYRSQPSIPSTAAADV